MILEDTMNLATILSEKVQGQISIYLLIRMSQALAHLHSTGYSADVLMIWNQICQNEFLKKTLEPYVQDTVADAIRVSHNMGRKIPPVLPPKI